MTLMSTIKAMKTGQNIEENDIISVEVTFAFSSKDTDRHKEGMKIISGKWHMHKSENSS